jgi:hypothetical protein
MQFLMPGVESMHGSDGWSSVQRKLAHFCLTPCESDHTAAHLGQICGLGKATPGPGRTQPGHASARVYAPSRKPVTSG